MTTPDSTRPEPGPSAGIEDIEADIEQTRAELSQTVQALSSKLDVKERTKQKAADTKERVVEKADALRHTATDNPSRTVPIAVAAVLALVVGIVIWRRRHWERAGNKGGWSRLGSNQ